MFASALGNCTILGPLLRCSTFIWENTQRYVPEDGPGGRARNGLGCGPGSEPDAESVGVPKVGLGGEPESGLGSEPGEGLDVGLKMGMKVGMKVGFEMGLEVESGHEGEPGGM